jgi:hypothetical protein
VSGREHDLAFLPGFGVDNKGESLPTVAPEKRFEPAVMACMSVRDDERAQVSDRHLQDIQVAGESGRCQAPVVQK